VRENGLPKEEVAEPVTLLKRSEKGKPGWVLDEEGAGRVAGPPALVIVLALVVVMGLRVVTDRFPPTGSSPPPVVLGLVVTEIELVGSVGELGELGELDEEVGVMVPPVLEREDGSLVLEGGGGEAVVPDKDFMVSVKLRGTPVPVTDVAGALEAGVPVEDVKGGLFGGVTRPLLGEPTEELAAMEELTVGEIEIADVEERSSGDDAEVEDVKLRREMGECRPTTHKHLR
jgi:hypothetical protein